MSRCKPSNKIIGIFLAFAGGCALGQAYFYLLKDIPFPQPVRNVISLALCVILGVGNTVSVQLRCISVLLLPMYCGRPGRGVLKAMVLTYIVAGPITNMGLNAREIIRVFACTTQLSYNLSMQLYSLKLDPARKAALSVRSEVEEFKSVFRGFTSESHYRSMDDVLDPMLQELEDVDEMWRCREENDFIDDLFKREHRSVMNAVNLPPNATQCLTKYRRKLQCRCENQLSRAVADCIVEFSRAYNVCCETAPNNADFLQCWPLMLTEMCNLVKSLDNGTCDSTYQVPSRYEDAYASIKRVYYEFVDNSQTVQLQYKIARDNQIYDIQDAKETADLVLHAFEEKAIIMHYVLTIMHVCMALLFLRIFCAAVTYHDLYLTNIDYDNVYVTDYFKRLDLKRKWRKTYFLLPLKKMERNKYIDAHGPSHKSQRKLVSFLKVALEVVTATTFVMLDRLFFEALDVVRQHAEKNAEHHATRDLEIEVTQYADKLRNLEIEVEGTGLPAATLRMLLSALGAGTVSNLVANKACLPRPSRMPPAFYCNIYCGYLCVLLLLFVNPPITRLRRTICSYFYPRREKQRILHLYNDILKKRMKMDKTIRRFAPNTDINKFSHRLQILNKAVQAMRAHYLTGENLLSMRLRFPQVLGWLRVLPAARRTCLICVEVEPRREIQSSQNAWRSCLRSTCPFVFCAECWREAGARCLACEPSLAELSDEYSLSEDELQAN